VFVVLIVNIYFNISFIGVTNLCSNNRTTSSCNSSDTTVSDKTA